jgi:phospholipid/cholesterol/gamma-HCH transport system substrate-binding protein
MTARIATPLVALGLLVLVIASKTSGESGHRVSVVVPSATSVVAGQDVRAAGRRVGRVEKLTPVDRGRAVRIGFRLGDEAWPLPRGSTFELRWGGTISFNNRYFSLVRPQSGAPVPEGATLPASAAKVPVEFEQLLGTFTPGVRRDVRTLVRRGGLALRKAGPELRRALDTAPAGAEAGHQMIRDLAADEEALVTLVRSTDEVVDAVRTADPDLRRLVRASATTLRAVTSEARGLQDTLERTPRTLVKARGTLRRADGTLSVAADLTDDLAPGVRELRRIAVPLNGLLETVVDVGPIARGTLATARRATPDVNGLLGRATTMLPRVESTARQAVEQLECIRPYSPEIAAFASTWGDFLSPTDGKDKYIRANIQQLLPVPHNVQSSNTGELKKQFPGMEYGFPRPPGEVAGQPWHLPQCGAGPDATNPFKDPEGERSLSSAAGDR